MPAQQSSTQPRSFVRWDHGLRTSVRRIYGYQPYCACGWTGKVWKTHHESQLERSFHDCEAAASRSASEQCDSEYGALGLSCTLPAGHAGPHSDTSQSSGRAESF